MKQIRKGIDLTIKWRVKLSNPDEKLDNLTLILTDNRMNHIKINEVNVSDTDVVTGKFYGKDLKVLGPYMATLWKNWGMKGQTCVDRIRAFELVPVAPPDNCVELQDSVLWTGIQGESAYQSWLNLGNEGSEEDFINSLKADFNIDDADKDKLGELIAEVSERRFNEIESDIELLRNDFDNIEIPEVDLSDYYNKEEVDNFINNSSSFKELNWNYDSTKLSELFENAVNTAYSNSNYSNSLIVRVLTDIEKDFILELFQQNQCVINYKSKLRGPFKFIILNKYINIDSMFGKDKQQYTGLLYFMNYNNNNQSILCSSSVTFLIRLERDKTFESFGIKILCNIQSKLTAGENITIENNVISATVPEINLDEITTDISDIKTDVTNLKSINHSEFIKGEVLSEEEYSNLTEIDVAKIYFITE